MHSFTTVRCLVLIWCVNVIVKTWHTSSTRSLFLIHFLYIALKLFFIILLVFMILTKENNFHQKYNNFFFFCCLKINMTNSVLTSYKYKMMIRTVMFRAMKVWIIIIYYFKRQIEQIGEKSTFNYNATETYEYHTLFLIY